MLLQTLIQQLLHDLACVVCSCIDMPHEQANEYDVDEDQCKELWRECMYHARSKT
jgi:hypothetical protein